MKIKILFFLLTGAVAQLSAQSNAVYSIRNNTTNDLLEIEALIEGENNSIYIVGEDYGTFEQFLVKLDNNGAIVWQKKLQTNLDSTHYLDRKSVV